VKADPELGRGVNTVDGNVTNEAVASALSRPALDLADALAT
jgi:alanine dehydrogenase